MDGKNRRTRYVIAGRKMCVGLNESPPVGSAIYHRRSVKNENLEQSPDDIDGLVQVCSISIANALEILQSCTKPSI